MSGDKKVFKRFSGTGQEAFAVPLEEALKVLKDNYPYLSEEQIVSSLTKASLHSPVAVYSFNKKEVDF